MRRLWHRCARGFVVVLGLQREAAVVVAVWSGGCRDRVREQQRRDDERQGSAKASHCASSVMTSFCPSWATVHRNTPTADRTTAFTHLLTLLLHFLTF